MLRGFHYANVTLERQVDGQGILVTGEIINRSGKYYNSVVFRIILFIKDIFIGNTIVTINGFCIGQRRRFEKQIPGLEYNKVIKNITRYEICAESGY